MRPRTYESRMRLLSEVHMAKFLDLVAKLGAGESLMSVGSAMEEEGHGADNVTATPSKVILRKNKTDD